MTLSSLSEPGTGAPKCKQPGVQALHQPASLFHLSILFDILPSASKFIALPLAAPPDSKIPGKPT